MLTDLPQQDEVKIIVNNQQFTGWQAFNLQRSIHAISSAFELSVMGGSSDDKNPFRAKKGDPCQIYISDDLILTGHIDSIHPFYDATRRTITVSGRDKLADLVDCSAVRKNGKRDWRGLDLEGIAKSLASEFKIEVVQEVNDVGKAFSEWFITEGESCLDCLDRAAKLRRLLLTSSRKGELVITQPGIRKSGMQLEEGVNILSAGADFNNSGRYSDYIVQSVSNPISDPGITTFSVKKTVLDPDIARYRPLLIIAEGLARDQTAIDRGEWERSVRKAKAEKLHAVVRGWRKEDQRLWDLNELVWVTSPWLYVDRQEYLISSTTFHLDSETGRTTLLELEPVEAYLSDPTLEYRKNTLLDWAAKEREGAQP